MTIASLQQAYLEKRFTAEEVVQLYLGRIDALDRVGPRLHSLIEVNPDALSIARRLDTERAAGRLRGPLHGVPVVLKDVIDTADKMHTTAGSLALLGSKPQRDAFIVQRLRDAGAILLGKTNLSEWSNCRSTMATSGWSARGGLTRNPYVLDRTASGSSSGTAASVAANLAMIGVGAETDGSISSPASANGLVGVKPTVGLLSRSGIIPISYSQDTAGPLARTVTDAALLLTAMTGKDARDLATDASPSDPVDYTAGLHRGALKGTRIGVAQPAADSGPHTLDVLRESLDVMRHAGATVVEDVEVPSTEEIQRAEIVVLLCEFKDVIREYLATRGPEERHRTLADLIRFNVENADVEMKWFGQEWFETAELTDGRRTANYLPALTRCRELTRTLGIDRAFQEHRLDAIVRIAAGPAFATDLINGDHAVLTGASLAAVAGYPRVTVPAGSFQGLPVGLSFVGTAWSEAKLLSLAYAFEQLTLARVAPRFLPTLDFDR
jgi:amidase